MDLNRVDFSIVKQFDPKTGCLNQLSFSDEKGWGVVGLTWFQRTILRPLPSCFLRLIGLSHIANTHSSYLEAVRFRQTGQLDDSIRKKVNEIFHRTFYPLRPTPSSTPSPVESKSAPKIEPPRGIINRGNNCYIIAMMQTLMNNPLFLKAFYAQFNQPHFGVDQEIFGILDALIIDYQCGANDRDLERSLNQLKEAIHRRNPRTFDRGFNAQQDSSAVMEVLFDLLNLNFKIWKEIHPPQHPTRLRIESIPFFHLPFYGDSLKECLDAYFADESVDFIPDGKDDPLPCERSTRLGQLPDFLCINLKRYGIDPFSGSMVKIDQAIEVDEIIDLAPYLKKGVQGSALYRVESVVTHLGGYGGGHYVSDVRKEGRWYHCNDKYVTEEAFPDLSQGYSFIFTKLEESLPTQVPKGIKRVGNTCYLNAFLQSMFALNTDSPELINLRREHEELGEEPFFQKVIALRDQLFGRPEEGMQDIQDLLSPWMDHFGLEKLTTENKQIPLIALSHLGSESLAEVVEERLKLHKFLKLPAILPVTVSKTLGGANPYTLVYPDTLVHVGDEKYRLKAAILHEDSHYKALVFKNEEWFRCDDLNVCKVDPSALSQATTFFYEKIT